jgi:cobalamin biosynthesis protein CobT
MRHSESKGVQGEANPAGGLNDSLADPPMTGGSDRRTDDKVEVDGMSIDVDTLDVLADVLPELIQQEGEVALIDPSLRLPSSHNDADDQPFDHADGAGDFLDDQLYHSESEDDHHSPDSTVDTRNRDDEVEEEEEVDEKEGDDGVNGHEGDEGDEGDEGEDGREAEAEEAEEEEEEEEEEEAGSERQTAHSSSSEEDLPRPPPPAQKFRPMVPNGRVAWVFYCQETYTYGMSLTQLCSAEQQERTANKR